MNEPTANETILQTIEAILHKIDAQQATLAHQQEEILQSVSSLRAGLDAHAQRIERLEGRVEALTSFRWREFAAPAVVSAIVSILCISLTTLPR